MNNVRSNSSSDRVLAALREARIQLEATKADVLEPIAVVGMSCRFPGSGANVDSFWEDLRAGVDAVREIPPDRWDIDAYYDPSGESPGKMYVSEAALLDQVDQFDPGFFGISPREAVSLDPQQRLLLEVCWEAIENAGLAPDSLAETKTGVFLGIGQNDYARLATGADRQNEINAYDGTGNGFCFAAGRVSYVLGLQGPNMAIDTACSSSLVAVHLAVQSLRRRESECALAAGVQLILSPEATIFLSQTKALARDGRSKPFDASANGYGRGEGCGVVVLKRFSDAQRSGDRILALIRGSAVNHDGPSSGLTVPNPHAQEALLRAALNNAGMRPDDIGYIETHGTGTVLGDPLELRALGAVFAPGRTRPLRIGSVKANIGHAEAAAGIAGLIKVILALRHREIPPCVHFRDPNPRIPWSDLPFHVPVAPTPWEDARRAAGVSSFSLSGTNAHVVVEAAPAVEAFLTSTVEAHLFTLSAKSGNALRMLAVRYRDHLLSNPDISLADLCFTASTGRSHLSHRLCVVVVSIEELRHVLEEWSSGAGAEVLTGVVPASGRSSVWFRVASEDWKNWGVEASEPLSREGSVEIDIDPAVGDLRNMLGTLGRLYVCGFPIRWSALYQRHRQQRIALPTYPFERQRYWLESSERVHPLLKRKIQSPLIAETLFEGVLTASSPAFLSDHRIFDEVVVPGAFHLSGLLEAACAMLGTAAVELRDVVFPSTLVIRKGIQFKLQLVLKPEPQGGFSFSLISFTGDSWSTNAQGWMGAAESRSIPDRTVDRCKKQVDVESLYAGLNRRGIQLGPSFRWISEAWSGGSEAFCRMQAPVALSGAYALHPGLVDSCFQLLGAGSGDAPGEDAPGNETYIPFRIERVRFEQHPVNEELLCSAGLRPPTSHEFRTGDVLLMNGGKQPILEVSGLEVRVHSKRTDPVYEVTWRTLAPSIAPQSIPSGKWLVLADASGIASSLEKYLRECGAQCVMVPTTVDLGNVDLADTRFEGVVHLWSLGARDVNAAQERACRSVIELLRRPVHAPAACYLITQGAHEVGGSIVDPLQSFLWGMQPVLRREHPDWTPVIIDLDPADNCVLDWRELFAQGHHEDRLAVRGDACWAPRLIPCSPPPREKLPIVAGKSYLITGGLGALGLRTAHWLVQNGATHLALAGRSAPDPAAASVIAKLRDAGAEVLTVAADVANTGDVERMIQLIATTLPPLAGVIHAAGVLNDQFLARQEWNDFRRVLAPKVDGAWNLHQQTLAMPLDFFVCFSSVASLIASPGQGAYATANAFLDGLMRARESSGLPGLSISWGPWSEDGMAARTEKRIGARLQSAGIESLPADDALRILGRAFHYSGSHLAVLDFRKLASRLPAEEMPRLLFEIATPKQAARREVRRKSDLIHRIAEAEFSARVAMLAEYLREQAGSALGSRTPLRDTGEGLTALGVDSLMALEMRTAIGNELGKEVPIVRFLDGSAIPDLAALLAAQFETSEAEASAGYAMAGAADRWVEGEL